MADISPARFEPKDMPEDWRDESLHRAAIRLNDAAAFPVRFPEDLLAYLWDLGYTLPRKGVFFLASARPFLLELAMNALPADDAADVRKMHVLMHRKEDAVANGYFDTAARLRDQEREIRQRVAGLPIYEIGKHQIDAALLRVDVDPDGGSEMTI